MQDQLEIMKELISTFLKDNREGKKKFIEWFLNSVMEEEARIQVSSLPYERTERKTQERIKNKNIEDSGWQTGTEETTDQRVSL